MKQALKAARTPEGKREQTENTILAILSTEPKGMQWSELLEKVGVSRKTLSDRLKSLEEKKFVSRHVDTEQRPPTVYYRVLDKARAKDIVILSKAIEEYQESVKSGLLDFGLENALMAIVRDVVFTIYHAANAPNSDVALALLHWHGYVHAGVLPTIVRKVMADPTWRKDAEIYYKDMKTKLEEMKAKLEEHKRKQET